MDGERGTRRGSFRGVIGTNAVGAGGGGARSGRYPLGENASAPVQRVNKATYKVGRAHVDLEGQTLVVGADEDRDGIHAIECRCEQPVICREQYKKAKSKMKEIRRRPGASRSISDARRRGLSCQPCLKTGKQDSISCMHPQRRLPLCLCTGSDARLKIR